MRQTSTTIYRDSRADSDSMATGATEAAMRNSPPAIAASPPARIARWRLELVVISELWNPGSEPGAIAAAANQKHRAEAIRRRRIQHVVDSKIAVRFERNASSGGAALDKGSRGFTDQCREDALDGILTDAVAAAKEQAATSDLETAVSVDVGSEIGDPPDGGGGLDPSHEVPSHVLERSICVQRRSKARHRLDTYAALESRERVTPFRAHVNNNPQGH